MPQGSGVIVDVAAAQDSSQPRAWRPIASKAALVHLTRTLAIELGAHGVRVNAVCWIPQRTGLRCRPR